MPYYRILIWTKRRNTPFKGIRVIDNPNINAVQAMVARKSQELYRQDFIDAEVQMLSKLTMAVKTFLLSDDSKKNKLYQK